MATPDLADTPDDGDDGDGDDDGTHDDFGAIGGPTGQELADAIDTEDGGDRDDEPTPDIGAGEADTPDPGDVDVADATIEDSDMDDSALFSGEEDKTESGPDDGPDGEEPDFDSYSDDIDGEQPGLAGPSSNQIEEAINEGAARLSVVGLDESDQSSLETEMNDVFEAFRLGFFGSRAVEEHVLANQEDVDPLWGFVGSALVCGAFALHMRPDGDEQLANIRRGLGLENTDSEDSDA